MQDAKDPETLANLVVCSLHLGKPASRFLRYNHDIQITHVIHSFSDTYLKFKDMQLFLT